MDPNLLDRCVDLVVLLLAVWYTHRITLRATGQAQQQQQQQQDHEIITLALNQTAQVIVNQAQLLGEYSKVLATLRGHRDDVLSTVAHAVAQGMAQGRVARDGMDVFPPDEEAALKGRLNGEGMHRQNVA